MENQTKIISSALDGYLRKRIATIKSRVSKSCDSVEIYFLKEQIDELNFILEYF